MSPPRLALAFVAWAGYAFLLLPTLVVVPMSFGDRDEFQFPPRRLSFYLYEKYLFESTWVATTVESCIVAAAAAAIALVIGLSAAYGLSRYDVRGKSLLLVLLMSPLFVPVIVVALGLYLSLARLGLSGTTAGLVLAHAVLTIPFVLVTGLAGLRQVDPALETAARVMGASRLRVVRTVTLPLLRPTIVAGGLFAFLVSFDEVVVAYFITSEQTQTLPVKMYSSITWEISPVLAAVASLLTALSFLVCIVSAVLQPTEPT
jgi:putative spermidine/putrescine transport system permease protein